ncbi:MAG: preprotein translocase subunit SecE [Desulfobacteraceae bacterium]|nr:MAG: preprotein translocase subunit SecE [Desulfobacteraceae bacterium]
MARLLRKKTTSNKKKTKQDSTDTPATPQETSNGLKKSIFIPDSSADTKKIQILPQKKVLTGTKTIQDKERNTYIDKALQFLREVKIELKKVTWPSRKQALGSTVVVIILVVIISLFLGVVDIGLSSLVRVVLR